MLCRMAPAQHHVSARAEVGHDGWHRERQAAFLIEIQATRSVTRAARAAGMSAAGAYRLKRRQADGTFAALWDRILAFPPPRPA